MNPRHWVALGALGTISLIGYESSLQAILNLDDGVTVATSGGSSAESVTPGDAAMLGQCTGLDAGILIPSMSSPYGIIPFTTPTGENLTWAMASFFDQRPDLGMIASVWNGFSPFTTQRNVWPLFSCISGNCTWDTFASLAVCARCHDISPHLSRSSGVIELPEKSNFGWVSEPDIHVTNTAFQSNSIMLAGKYRYTKYEIPPLGLNLSNYDGERRCDGKDRCPDTYLTGKVETNPGRTINFKDLRTLIFSFGYMAANESYLNNETLWEDTTVSAGECVLYYCINAYESEVVRGELAERLVGSWADKTPGSYWVGQEHEVEYTEYVNHTLDYRNLGANMRSDLQLTVPAGSGNLSGLTFGITQASIVSTIDFITGPFSSYGSSASSGSGTFDHLVYPSLGWRTPPGLIEALGAVPPQVRRSGSSYRCAPEAANPRISAIIRTSPKRSRRRRGR